VELLRALPRKRSLRLLGRKNGKLRLNIRIGKTISKRIRANHPINGQRTRRSTKVSANVRFVSVTRSSPPPTIKEAAMIIRARKAKPTKKPRSARRKKKNRKNGIKGPDPLSGDDPAAEKLDESERTSLKKKLRLRRKYKGKALTDFPNWREIQEKFLYDRLLIYREDGYLRKRFMKCISDTANTYMRIRRALGFREYDWEDNPHLFLHMGLSKTVWRKAVKRLVDCKVTRLKC